MASPRIINGRIEVRKILSSCLFLDETPVQRKVLGGVTRYAIPPSAHIEDIHAYVRSWRHRTSGHHLKRVVYYADFSQSPCDVNMMLSWWKEKRTIRLYLGHFVGRDLRLFICTRKSQETIVLMFGSKVLSYKIFLADEDIQYSPVKQGIEMKAQGSSCLVYQY